MNQGEVAAKFADHLSWPDARLLDWASQVVSVPNRLLRARRSPYLMAR